MKIKTGVETFIVYSHSIACVWCSHVCIRAGAWGLVHMWRDWRDYRMSCSPILCLFPWDFFFTNPELMAIQLAWWPENPSNLSTPPSLQGLYVGTATPRFYVNLGHLNPDLHAYSANSHTHWNSSPAQSWHFCMTVTVCRILTQAFYLYLIPAVFNMYLCTYVCEAQPPLRILSLKASFGWESVKMTVCPQWTLLETEVMSCPVPRFLLSEVLCGL